MLSTDQIDHKVYAELQEEIKLLNMDYYSLRKSQEYKLGMVLSETVRNVKKMDFSTLKKQYKRWFGGQRGKKYVTVEKKYEYESVNPEHYFSGDRIAVYTVIFGKYDELLEPYCVPSNIDYYVITDQDVDLKNSAWKRVDISAFEDNLKGLTNIEKNRFFKMKPYVVFPNYRYSIYIDGNIEIISDMTEHIYKIKTPGIAAHWHTSRDCVYDEMMAVLAAKKEKKEILEIHQKHLLEEDFPKHYGLIECNVLVREHTDICKKIMENWWDEFLKFSRRDQLSFPYVLHKCGYTAEEVATLGINVFKNPTIRVKVHN